MDWLDYALPLVKRWEGLRLDAYLCPAGIPTIGYGTTGPHVKLGLRWTRAQAEAALLSDLKELHRDVRACVRVPLTPQQAAALVSFAYNLGIGSLRSSTLLKLLNAGRPDAAARQFGRWVWASTPTGRRKLPGLISRRADERALFEQGRA